MTLNDDNPWKGLNFYNEGEILYGRDKEIQSLARYIINNSQTVLYGKSGIGKSSIINAGIFPIARQEGLFPVPMRLEHESTDPSSYLTQIKHAFEKSGITMIELLPVIDEQNESLWEFFHRHKFTDPATKEAVRPLVVFDQFEEFFTLQQHEKAKKEFFSELADLINEVTPRYIYDAQHAVGSNSGNETTLEDLHDFMRHLANADKQTNYVDGSNFNLVFVLREDFLSFFERYTAYIPAMKSNRFPLLPLNEEQAAEIIMRPRPGLVSKEVAELIIQKVTGTTEFTLDGIPEIEVSATMLSLYLSRLYLKKGSQPTITAEMVNQFGDYIIKDYYEESIADIPEDEIEKLEDSLITYDGRRDNDSLTNLKHKDEKGRAISNETIKKLVEERKLLRLFRYQDDDRLEFMHDTLCDTINDRISQRQQAKQQEEERQRQEAEKAKIRQEEESKRKEIERQAELERQRHEQETLLIKKRNRRRIKWLAFAAALLGFILLAVFIRHQLLYTDYSCTYGNFTTVNGWPVGLGEIDPDNKDVTDSLIVYYKLTRHGRLKRDKSPFYKVEVISARNHKPTTNKFIESPAVGLWYSEFSEDTKGAQFAELQKQTSYWIYTANEQNYETAGKCTAFDRNHNELYSIQFNRDNTNASVDEKKYVQWAVYYDASGKQMMINDNGIDRMRQSIDSGIVKKCLFFSMLGVPQKNERGAYGYEYDINGNTHLVRKLYRVDQFGKRADEMPIDFIDYQFGRVKETSLYKVYYPQPGIIVKQFKNYNDTLAFHLENDCKPKFGSFHPDFTRADSVISFSYNKNGLPVTKQIRSKGKVTRNTAYTYYDGTDKYKEVKIIDLDNDYNYTERYTYPDSSTIIVSLWKDGEKVMPILLNEKGDDLCYHSCTTTTRTDSLYSIETKEYRDSVGNLIKPDPSDEYVNQYCIFEIYRDKLSKNILFEYYRDYNGMIQKSELFEYDPYGNLIAKAVAGVDFKPVRCLDWSWYDLCCYKMSILTPFFAGQTVSATESGVFASMHGINEFSESSLIMGYDNIGRLCNIAIDETSMGFFSKKENEGRLIQTGFNLSQTSISPCNMRYSAFFIHILDKKGSFYSAGLKDGDIIIKINGSQPNNASAKALENNHGECRLDIARANTDNPNDKKYDNKSFSIHAGEPYIHVHQIELTAEEYDRLNKSIQ